MLCRRWPTGEASMKAARVLRPALHPPHALGPHRTILHGFKHTCRRRDSNPQGIAPTGFFKIHARVQGPTTALPDLNLYMFLYMFGYAEIAKTAEEVR